MNNTIKKFDLIFIYRVRSHKNKTRYFQVQWTFFKIHHMLSHKKIFNEFKGLKT